MSDAAPETTAPSEDLRQVVAFLLDQEAYAVPIEAVREVVEVPKLSVVPNGQAFILGVMNLRGQIVPVIDLEKLFGLQRDSTNKGEHIMIAEDDNHNLFGVQVDTVTEVLSVPADSIKPAPTVVAKKIANDYVTGVIVLQSKQADRAKEGDERMLLLLDLHTIIASIPAQVAPKLDNKTSNESKKVSKPL